MTSRNSKHVQDSGCRLRRNGSTLLGVGRRRRFHLAMTVTLILAIPAPRRRTSCGGAQIAAVRHGPWVQSSRILSGFLTCTAMSGSGVRMSMIRAFMVSPKQLVQIPWPLRALASGCSAVAAGPTPPRSAARRTASSAPRAAAPSPSASAPPGRYRNRFSSFTIVMFLYLWAWLNLPKKHKETPKNVGIVDDRGQRVPEGQKEKLGPTPGRLHAPPAPSPHPALAAGQGAGGDAGKRYS